MSDMIEKVARALARHDNPKHENWWPSYESRARAAIEAMREPTEAMKKAMPDPYGVDEHWPHQMYPKLGFSAQSAWQAMIDAALSETGER